MDLLIIRTRFVRCSSELENGRQIAKKVLRWWGMGIDSSSLALLGRHFSMHNGSTRHHQIYIIVDIFIN